MTVFASEEVQKSRLTICHGCPKLTTFKVCQMCGCLMTFKVKLKDATCPVGAWALQNGQRTIQEETQRSS